MADEIVIGLGYGRKINLCDLRRDDISFEEIATSLSRINRFAGNTSRPYSVAEHSVRVCDTLERCWAKRILPTGDTHSLLYALLHDAAEAYTGDVINPVKRWLHDDAKQAESDACDRIATFAGCNLSAVCEHQVSIVDRVHAAIEMRDLMRWNLKQLKDVGMLSTETEIKIYEEFRVPKSARSAKYWADRWMIRLEWLQEEL